MSIQYVLLPLFVEVLLTFAVMFGCGVVISTLVVRLRRQERDAISRERRTAALQAFTRDVAESKAKEGTNAGRQAGHPLEFTTEPEE